MSFTNNIFIVKRVKERENGYFYFQFRKSPKILYEIINTF